MYFLDPADSIHVITKGACHAKYGQTLYRSSSDMPNEMRHDIDLHRHRNEFNGPQEDGEKAKKKWLEMIAAKRLNFEAFKYRQGEFTHQFYINMTELAIITPKALHFKTGDIVYSDPNHEFFAALRPQ